MNSFEINKIVMALLLTVLVIIGINGLTEVIFEEEKLASNAYPIEVAEADAEAADAQDSSAVIEEGPSLAQLLSVASASDGEAIFKKCKACHTQDMGGKNLVGPNLWNIVGRAKGGHEGFSFSDAMYAKGGNWTYEDLDHFLTKPSDFVPKTKMSFAGLKKATDRASIIAFLRSLSDAPADLPMVEISEDVATEEAPVEEVPAADTAE
ncbi:MAG: cytochrome c family protein [Emcibacter sp.]|nr:cytochrome c family protein [Emcibacter sp.]